MTPCLCSIYISTSYPRAQLIKHFCSVTPLHWYREGGAAGGGGAGTGEDNVELVAGLVHGEVVEAGGEDPGHQEEEEVQGGEHEDGEGHHLEY